MKKLGWDGKNTHDEHQQHSNAHVKDSYKFGNKTEGGFNRSRISNDDVVKYNSTENSYNYNSPARNNLNYINNNKVTLNVKPTKSDSKKQKRKKPKTEKSKQKSVRIKRQSSKSNQPLSTYQQTAADITTANSLTTATQNSYGTDEPTRSWLTADGRNISYSSRGKLGKELQWSFAGSLLYSVTVVATIGESN